MKILRLRKRSTKPPTLEGKVAIVTGANSGIGAVTAKELAQRGAIVVLAARRATELEAQAKAITEAGYCAVTIPTDVTDLTQIRQLTERTTELFGRVDVLVNNAGILWRESYMDNSIEQIEQIINVNLLSTILLTHVVLPGMLERHHGSLIFVASVAAQIAVDPLYCATKFGVRGFALSLRRELANTGVSVSVVSPGFVRTPLNSHIRMPMPGPEPVARAIADLATHPRREMVVPGFYRPIIEGERLFPSIADHLTQWGRSLVIAPTRSSKSADLPERSK
jgi:NAD(P)-dependent dehydrogenase (short-subunit alcohol dehydrogenase family)